MGEHARAVRSLPAWSRRTGSKQVLVLILLVAMAFGTAIYLGIRHPYQTPAIKQAEPLRITMIPLAPQGPVPGGTPADLYAHSPAANFRLGAAGINLPGARRTKNFSESQVMTALTTAKDYLVESSLDPDVLTGGAVRPVRVLLDPDQLEQFDRSIATPAADGRHAATGWLVRFDPAKVALADTQVRVQGTLRFAEAGPDALEVTSDHTFAYALRPVGVSGPGANQASLFTVRRELHFPLRPGRPAPAPRGAAGQLRPGWPSGVLGGRLRNPAPAARRRAGDRGRPGGHGPVCDGPGHRGTLRLPVTGRAALAVTDWAVRGVGTAAWPTAAVAALTAWSTTAA